MGNRGWEFHIGRPHQRSCVRTVCPMRNDFFDEAARILAGWPMTTARLAKAHTPDADGRCRTCALSGHRGPMWPCRLAILAAAAQAYRAQRR